MPYTVMIWLVDREHSLSSLENHDPSLTPGASSGVIAGPAFDRLHYGFYETGDEANQALEELAGGLERNVPVRVEHEKRTFLIPASRVHYAVCEEVVRPKDEARAVQAPVRLEEAVGIGA